MPSRNIRPGDTVFLRAEALSVGSDFVEVRIDDGQALCITAWVPARECARQEDICELKPIRRRSRFIDR